MSKASDGPIVPAAPGAPELNTLDKSLLGVKAGQLPTLLPGLLAAGLLAWLSTWLSEFIGVSLLGFERTPISEVMVAIVLGLVISNRIRLPAMLKPGFTFAVKKALRLGIILLGIRLSLFDVLRFSTLGVPIVLLTILSGLFFTTRLNRWLRLPERLGTLIAVGTAICGVTAIVATAPAIDAEDEEVAYAVAVITTFGILATLVYPFAAHAMCSADPVRAGLFMGTAIHDTSQVTGAALVYADVYSLPRALDVATVTKLVRNVFMAAVIPLMALSYVRKTRGQAEVASGKIKATNLLPLFIVGFLCMAALRSVGDAGINAGGSAFGMWDTAAWQSIHGFIKDWAVNFLVVALAGVGLSTSFRMIRGLGIKPFIVGLGAALIVGVVSFVSICLLGTLLTL